jgi:predicted tellurium resistance membrane protein TerC
MEKYPYLEKSAFIVIGILGVKLCFALLVRFNKEQFEWIESEAFDLFISVLTLLIFALPILSARITSKKK